MIMKQLLFVWLSSSVFRLCEQKFVSYAHTQNESYCYYFIIVIIICFTGIAYSEQTDVFVVIQILRHAMRDINGPEATLI